MATPSRKPMTGSGCSPIRPAPASGDVMPVRNACCGKDLGPVEDREAPSEEDLERFGSATRNCPACKEEVYDDVEVCYHCGEAFSSVGGAPLPRWVLIAAGLVVGGMVFLLLFR